MVTLLLILGFLGMAFQLTTARYMAELDGYEAEAFQKLMLRAALFLGIAGGFLVFASASALQNIFNLGDPALFRVFAVGIPIYFMLSVQRGRLQGQSAFIPLSLSYQSEMWMRLVLTLLLLWIFPAFTGLIVSLGILFSLLAGMNWKKLNLSSLLGAITLDTGRKRMIYRFALVTVAFEFCQILVNNSDIMMVKHYFPSYDAGLYASLALVGRIVYFVAWMLAMILLPAVVKRKEAGINPYPLLQQYLLGIGVLAFLLVVGSYLFPALAIRLLFGENYLPIAPLLWQYALAAGLFALANLVAYFYLCLEEYRPILFIAIAGIAQVVLIVFLHEELGQVVQLQGVLMALLLAVQLIFMQYRKRSFLSEVSSSKQNFSNTPSTDS